MTTNVPDINRDGAGHPAHPAASSSDMANPEPEPVSSEPLPPSGSASQWRLMWLRLRRHRLAMAGGFVTLGVYIVAIFAGFLAPYGAADYEREYAWAPPQPLRLIDARDGDVSFRPHVLGYTATRDPDSWQRVYEVDESEFIPVRFFARGGEPYRFLGVQTDLRLIGPADPSLPMYLLGADRLGRDIFSRVIHGTGVSMSIGLIGVALSLLLGIVLGGISGYFGGNVDAAIQRIIEFLMSLPTIPLWMALAAALPSSWTPLQIYAGITVILSLIGWTTLAREVRGRFYSLRNEDFVTAARLDGADGRRVMFRHMLPSIVSHLIAATSLAVPSMILAETSLSFLGLGLQPPMVSWGVLLQEAQNVRTIIAAPWLMIAPCAAVVVAVLSLNFLGDGLRDAADPYG